MRIGDFANTLAVDREKGIAGTDRLANRVGKDLFDASRHLAMNVCEVGFVVGHIADNSNLFGERSHLPVPGLQRVLAQPLAASKN
jgi:Na+/serine symporter